MRQRKKTAHPVAAPVHRRLELARLLDLYLADSLTNYEMQRRIDELLPEPCGDEGRLHWALDWYFEDALNTRTFRQWKRKRQASEREFLERVILFLRSDLDYVETNSRIVGCWCFVAPAFFAAMVTSFLALPDFTFPGWWAIGEALFILFSLFYAYTLLAVMIYSGLSVLWNFLFGSKDDHEAEKYWPFAGKADYLAHTPSECSHEPGHPGSA